MTEVCMVTSLAPSREPENQTARKRPSRNSTRDAACTACPGEEETNCASNRKRPSGEACCGGKLARGGGLGAPAGGLADCAANGEAGARCRIFHAARAKASTSK